MTEPRRCRLAAVIREQERAIIIRQLNVEPVLGRLEVSEPEPGRRLVESELTSRLVTNFTVTPVGERCLVRIETRWPGASGIGGFFERLFAPRLLRRVFADELERLNRYASQQPPP